MSFPNQFNAVYKYEKHSEFQRERFEREIPGHPHK